MKLNCRILLQIWHCAVKLHLKLWVSNFRRTVQISSLSLIGLLHLQNVMNHVNNFKLHILKKSHLFLTYFLCLYLLFLHYNNFFPFFYCVCQFFASDICLGHKMKQSHLVTTVNLEEMKPCGSRIFFTKVFYTAEKDHSVLFYWYYLFIKRLEEAAHMHSFTFSGLLSHSFPLADNLISFQFRISDAFPPIFFSNF